MALREIIILPDKQLRLVSKPVEKVTAEIRRLADDMLETMYDAPGIGLAAIQVAQPLRLITMDLAKNEDGETTPRPRGLHQPRDPDLVRTRWSVHRGRLPCRSPSIYDDVERPAAGDASATPTSTAGSIEHHADGLASPPASSTSSITSTACCYVDYLSRS